MMKKRSLRYLIRKGKDRKFRRMMREAESRLLNDYERTFWYAPRGKDTHNAHIDTI